MKQPCGVPARQPAQPRRERRSLGFWLLVLGTAVFMTLEPGLFLVTVALALSALALFWVLLLARLLVSDAVTSATRHLRTGHDRETAP